MVPAGGAVLDVACGAGRHLRLFRDRSHPVTGMDIDLSAIAGMAAEEGVEIIEVDLEGGAVWPLVGRRFAGVVVTNYLYRPLFPHLIRSVGDGGVLLYETFARGNEQFGKPRNPDHLLAAGELLEAVRGHLHVVAYEHGLISHPRFAAVERICAIRSQAGIADPLYELEPEENRPPPRRRNR